MSIRPAWHGRSHRVGERALVDDAVALARRLQERARELQTPQEQRQQAELDRMIHHPHDKATLVQMTDQAFRSVTPRRSADQLTYILDVQGVPRFFSPFERTLLRGFQSFGGYLPGVAVPLVKEKMQQETANVILPAEPDELRAHLRARRAAGVRMNLNFLGEALLGEADAERRLQRYLEALQDPDIEVLSVKISTIFSQIDPIARAHTLAILCDRLELLFRAAGRARFRRADGREVPKFVYLDMEEYRDMSITADAFMATLDRPGLADISAGLALQAYIPDSFATQRRITEWAVRRGAAGGAPVTLRLVKGANLEMERVDASLHGWPQAPFKSKRETDANYKRMLHYALQPAHAAAVHIGLASHNLFELAYGLTLAAARGVGAHVGVEMLEGMANHQRRALFEHTGTLLLYAPACRREDFVNAIGYLIRRLDENTGPDNFLRHAFRLRVDSEDWRALEADFRASFAAVADLPDAPRRWQDRRRPPQPAVAPERGWREFVNEPDTDFALPHNAEWAESVTARWRERSAERAAAAALVVAGRTIRRGRAIGTSIDPSRPGVIVGRYPIATAADIDAAVACARADPDGWRDRSAAQRGAVLRAAAQQIRQRRADLIGIALAEGGRIVRESDPEVSEAVDFCELYARAAEDLDRIDAVRAIGIGVAVVVPPWNFPISIPCGGVAAALAAGNTVILKPAPATVVTAHLLAECFWAAGVPKRALQFVFGADESEAMQLVTHAGVDAVVFTGGTETALHLLGLKPALYLIAETGGKNSTIVTAMADRERAIKHVVHSAFSHAGQKCSATSLLILEREVYESAAFRDALCDAARSLPVGSAWDAATRVAPLIGPPAGKLDAALKELDPGESWALRPQRSEANPNLWSPGIKWGVRPGSTTHMTELFGPVLGVMCAANLDEAIAIANATGYGLTAGLHSLDEREQAAWAERIRAGNLYINRGTTGAIVLRQPFGGVGKSAIGPGLKAGGPHYLVPLMRWRETATPPAGGPITDGHVAALLDALAEQTGVGRTALDRLRGAVASYARAMDEEFSRRHDHFRLIGQDNFRLYRPAGHVRVRVDPRDSWFDVFARACAAKLAGCFVTISTPAANPHVELLHALTEPWAAAIEFVEESDAELAAAIRAGQADRVRYAARERVPDAVYRAAAAVGLFIATAPVLSEGRLELLWYHREQSLCIDYHRYGNLGPRAGEMRREPE